MLSKLNYRTSRDAPTGHKLFNFISTSLQPRRWAHIKRSLKKMMKQKDYPAEPHVYHRHSLLAPLRHSIPFAIIFLPVVASIIAASMIHKFSFFYLVIPGFWCYGVGGLILDGVFGGSFSDNYGTALRSKSPIRFWGKIGIWSLFYILAAAFPIGFALQEHEKTTTISESGPRE